MEVGDVVTVGVDDEAVGYGDGVKVAVEVAVPVGRGKVGVSLAVGVNVPKLMMTIVLAAMGTLGTHNLSPGDT